jgi:hypothetical protein
MTTILLQISSPHIRKITIHIDFPNLFEDDGWDLMDEIISRPLFSSLESLTFHFSWGGYEHELSWFKQKLPLCAARGILSVIHV